MTVLTPKWKRSLMFSTQLEDVLKTSQVYYTFSREIILQVISFLIVLKQIKANYKISIYSFSVYRTQVVNGTTDINVKYQYDLACFCSDNLCNSATRDILNIATFTLFALNNLPIMVIKQI